MNFLESMKDSVKEMGKEAAASMDNVKDSVSKAAASMSKEAAASMDTVKDSVNKAAASMGSMTKVRWGVAGCGLISEDMASAMKLLPASEHTIVAVAASSLEKAQRFIQKFELTDAKAYGSYNEMYHDTNIDCVYIGLLNTQHHENVMNALEAGRNVLCEKPLALSSKEVREMVNKAREKKLFLMEAYWSRYFPVYKRIREELSKKSLGDVQIVQGAYGIEGNLPRHTDLELGGGYLYDIGCYIVQLTLMVFGAEKPQQILATGWQSEKGVDETASVTLKFSGKRMATLLVTGNFKMRNQAVIYGTKGHIYIPTELFHPDTMEIQHTEPDKTTQKLTWEIPMKDGLHFNFGHSNGLCYELAGVRDHLLSGRTESPVVPLDESILISEILEEMRLQLGVSYPQTVPEDSRRQIRP